MNCKSEGLIEEIKALRPVVWINENKVKAQEFLEGYDLKFEDIIDAERRLLRFAPLIKRLFPETVDGIIESPLVEINDMKNEINKHYKCKIKGRLYMKCDSHLEIAGSIKARGGIYEVLKHAETLALQKGILKEDEDYSKLGNDEYKEFFSNYSIGVGSTGNLGLSIGIISAVLGFKVNVHMSRDAKEWKKQLLIDKGAKVIQYNDDYSKAVEEGRKLCKYDKKAYFIDDENSKDLFLGYSVAALRLSEVLKIKNITVDKEHQLYVYLPCGVGGAPGGITFGLKSIFKDNVHCFFVEPTHSPCMLLGLLTGKHNNLHVGDYGIDNITEADGLAVGSPSKIVSLLADRLIDGIYTIEDEELFKLLSLLKNSEDLKIEPSAAASLFGPTLIQNANENIHHIVWATGGLLLPDDLYESMYKRGQELI